MNGRKGKNKTKTFTNTNNNYYGFLLQFLRAKTPP
jgi:hypothetical protein